MPHRIFLCLLCTTLFTLGCQNAYAAPTAALPPADCTSQTPLDISQRVLPPNVQRAEAANPHAVFYPPTLRAMGIQGNPAIRYIIDASGKVTDVTVQQTSGNADLDAAAVTSVQSWLYHPTLCDGKPISARFATQIIFQVRDEGPSVLRFVATPAEFPAGAQGRGESGATWLMVDIATTTTPERITVLESSGYADLDAAAGRVVHDRLEQKSKPTDQQPAGRLPVIVVWPGQKPAN